VIIAEKSVYSVVAMIAVMRVGAAFVPVEPSNPALRIAKIIADSGAVLTLSSNPSLALVGPVVDLESLDSAPPRNPSTGGGVEPSSGDDLAYILYTSGSTGTPKGVCISHRNALAFVEWAAASAGLDCSDRLANHASFNFDLSVFDLYATFLVGASVWLIPADGSGVPRVVAAFLERHRITVLYCVPSVLIMLLEEGMLPSLQAELRTVIFAGEPFPLGPLKTLRRSLPLARMFNYYGPTETNVCTSYEVTAADLERNDPIPIGTPASGARIWIRDDDGQIARDGEEGELMVEGPTVMLGYWGQPPVVGGVYGTGDRAKRGPDGNFVFLGRTDSLVKIRGRRIDLGEIESALSERSDVVDVAVVVTRGVAARLRAYLVPRRSEAPSLLDLKRFLAERVPSYMIVDEVVSLTALPRTARGKLDRARLMRMENEP